jgi:chromosome segregation ATPase
MMTETGNPPTAEELTALREQLSEAQADLGRLRTEAADAESRAAAATTEAATLRNELAATVEARRASEAEAHSAREYLQAAEARLRAAAEKYRDLVVRTEPELPEELISGDDIEAVDASVESARGIVGRVRSHIDAQAQAMRVPAGAPARGASDYGALSPEQKIRIGLAQRAG